MSGPPMPPIYQTARFAVQRFTSVLYPELLAPVEFQEYTALAAARPL